MYCLCLYIQYVSVVKKGRYESLFNRYPGRCREMSERKVINKYIPADFDPNDRFSLPRGPKRPKTVRVMVPFSLRCTTCGEFIYKGRKFNARKETVEGDYLGIPIFRFYIRCVYCSSEITYVTDPKNADYTIEQGGTRNAEPWRDQEKETEAAKAKKRFEEEMNPMKALENKTVDSKREIDMAEAIEDLRAKKAEMERTVSASLLIRARPTANPKPVDEGPLPELDAEEEIKIKQAFSKRQEIKPSQSYLPAVTKPKAKPRLDFESMGIRIKPKQSD